VLFTCQELTVELMAAKVELEAYIGGLHPDPLYLRYHISLCSETMAKQPPGEGYWLASDGFPRDVVRKDMHAFAVKTNNGHTGAGTKTDMLSNVTSGI